MNVLSPAHFLDKEISTHAYLVPGFLHTLFFYSSLMHRWNKYPFSSPYYYSMDTIYSIFQPDVDNILISIYVFHFKAQSTHTLISCTCTLFFHKQRSWFYLTSNQHYYCLSVRSTIERYKKASASTSGTAPAIDVNSLVSTVVSMHDFLDFVCKR